ncbi:MAG: hypothetical protein GEU74_09350 [Nitriliruptorales bacterium]|nr:hypothetical protein [Nitriliruptorales bacterium]
MPQHHPGDHRREFPRVPAYAWAWLQRSRPVLAEVSHRLTGDPPGTGFVDYLQERFPHDAFTRDIVVGVIADVAFNGRIPRHRPAGASWDRGLTWWAAAIAGVTPQEFDAASPPVVQTRLFGVEEQPPSRPGRGAAGRRTPSPSERAALVAALRDLVRTAQGDSVPVSAIRELLRQLEGPHSAERRDRQ